MLVKTAPFLHVKALPADEADVAPGTFEAIIAPFNVVDLYGEVVEPGAFGDALKSDWPKLVWTHQWNQPPIGVTLDIKEVPAGDYNGVRVPTGGVYAKGRLFVADDEDSQLARQVWTALKATDGQGVPGLDEFSYAYNPVDGGIEDREGDRVYVIRKAEMIEWGPCLKGVNEATQLLSVKSAQEYMERRGELEPSSAKAADPAHRERINTILAAHPRDLVA